MNRNEIAKKVNELEQQIELLPKGTLVYKTIAGKKKHSYML